MSTAPDRTAEGPPCLLLVDDEPLLLRAVARLLRIKGFEVHTAENGSVALLRLAERVFDLVLCDVRMPVMDGPTLLQTVRQGQPEPPPFVFLTGYGDLSDRQLLAMGAQAVTSKPIDSAALLDLIHRWRRAEGPRL